MKRLARVAAWFDPRGRLSRRVYARVVVRLLLLSVALFCAAIVLGSQGWREAALAAVGGIVGIWLASLAQAIRRLHDRGRSGWWLSIPLILTALSFVPVETQADAHPLAVVAYTVATLVASAWFLMETLGRHGTAGPNGYGPEPPGR
ncbi:DUF805 domain-containing protein [Methylobacterium haplocladii]|uniref:DUF805 domain-containing protein n=1 Tax=Methylobacterium haplocladii TaxID=1176176 RepID=A0A512IJ69_9HYPH|nr:DUF805 domain-containing protein [Methylobacterium haplocladii]GEO97751.1 hypothetical protein MHA02_01390 [Methylobacterium haplocladii]GLS57616.1 hypothetical protein GCM10007887_02710 [Methylobacterium haplocladii]